jgi:hypothetical protein
MELPLINALGMNVDQKLQFVNNPETMYEWLLDTYSPATGTAAATNITNSSTTTNIAVATNDGVKFQVGDVIMIDAEYMWVSTISTDTLTVTRNYGGTQATHASTAAIYMRSGARLEGAAAGDGNYTAPTSDYNYTFIMQKTIEVSRSDQRIQKYGIPNIVDREIDKAMKELSRKLTMKPYYGIRSAGSATTPRDCGGFDTFIATNVTTLTGSPALTQKNIEDAVVTCWNNGGSPNLLVCNAWPKRKLADWFGGFVRTGRSDKMGGIEISTILTSIGIELDVLVDRYCPTTSMYILDTSLCGFWALDPFFYENLGKTKDTAKDGYGEVVGEYGFALADEKKHAKISGFSVTI